MATSNNVPLPSTMELRGDLANNWQFFKEQGEDYIDATKSERNDELIKATLLQTVMGRVCLKLSKSINLSSTESQDNKACLASIRKIF